MKIAIVFLTNEPKEGTIEFAKRVKEETNYDVFIVADDNSKEYDVCCGVKIIQEYDVVCSYTGYFNSNISDNSTHIKKNPIAMDKFLYSFCEHTDVYDYDFVFVLEDDVFVPSVSAIKNFINKYSCYDLVTPNNFLKNDTVMDWHWRSVFDKHEPPYYYSMVCAMGLSKKMFSAIKDYVKKNKTLFYIEVMFNTICHHRGLSVFAPLELKSIVWMGSWGRDEWALLPENFFHPMKNINEHEDYRETILDDMINVIDGTWIPVNKLPKFITEVMPQKQK